MHENPNLSRRATSFARHCLASALLLVLVLSIFSVAGCRRSANVKGKTLRVVFSAAPDAIDTFGYRMVDILREQGIDVKVTLADGGSKAVQAILAGQADIGASQLDDVINGGLVAFALSRPKNTYAMVVQKNIKTMADLKGKVIGEADPGSAVNVISDAVMEKNGLPASQVKHVSIGGNGARAAALVAGKVDAIWTYGSNYLKLRAAGFPTLTTVPKELPGIHDDMWCAKKEWLDKNGDLAVAVAKAQLQAAKWFREKPEEWLKLAAEKVDGLDQNVAKELYTVLKDMDAYPLNGLMTADTVMDTFNFLSKAGAVPNKPMDSWATLKYMDQARKELGIK